MSDFISCVAIDIINYDKPPASLAFLAGVCEAVDKPYQCFSLNSEFLDAMSVDEYNKIYTKIKLGLMQELPDKAIDVIYNIVNNIKNQNTNLLLLSVFSYVQAPIAELFLKHLRTQIPDLEIMAGGPGVQSTHRTGVTLGKYLLDNGFIDYYCLGEGDEVLVEWLHGNKNLLGINGKEHKIETWVPQIKELDKKYIVPSYRNINLKNYQNLENKKSTVFSLSTSRGCVRDCSFCDVAKTWSQFRFRSGASVAQEVLKHHQEVGAVNFTIVDSLINGSLRSFREFNHEMVKLKAQYPGLNEFSYNGMFIVRDARTHDEQLFATMRDAGCESLALGVETGSDRLRFDMNKKFTNRDLDHHFEMCQKYKIRNSLLTFVGYPTETTQDFEQTLEMLERYQKYLIDDTIIGINHSGVFGLLPDTPVYDQREELGLEVVQHYNTAVTQLDWVNHNNPDLTVQERIMRDLRFRKRAAELRYPVPYSRRYLEYLKFIDKNLVVVPD